MRDRFMRRTAFGVVIGVAAAASAAAMGSVGAGVSPVSTPAAAEQYREKVTICHRTRSKKNPFRTIRVSESAVKAHLRHGDVVGACPTAVFTMCHKTKAGKKKTVKVKGARKAARALRKGDKLGKCKASGKPQKDKQKGKGKGKGKKKGK
jgi:hypothetical protein